MRPTHLVTLLVLLALATASAPTPAQAGGVVSVCDEAHLLAALAGGGTVTFSCSGTIILTAEIVIAADTTIDGSGQSVTLSGNHAVRVFTVNYGVTLNLNALTVADGSIIGDHGGGINNSGTLTVSTCILDGNSAGQRDARGGSGGGIFSSGTLNVSNSSFSGNSAYRGGGIYDSFGTAIVNNTTFFGYSAAYAGGGIDTEYGTVTVSNSTFSGNSATYDGGGMYHNDIGTVIVSFSTFAGNTAANNGGGIYNSSTLAVSNSTFSGNKSGYNGGGIHNRGNDGLLTVSNSTFSGNSATYDGGGIFNQYGTTTVDSTTFSGNSVYRGGGIWNDYGTLNVSNSTFSGNTASTNGGGTSNCYRGTMTISNSTFSGNNALSGGGIYSDSDSTVDVSSSTFAGNNAGTGGGIYSVSGTGVIKNTIVANSPTGSNCAGSIADGGGNLSYPDATCPGINSDPVLGPLQNNLGPTQTMALGAGSAAIDAANDAICAAPPINNLDQRGIARPQGPHCDIGAYEDTGQPFLRIFLPIIMR